MNKRRIVMKDLIIDAMKYNVLRYCNDNQKCEDRCFIKDLCYKYHAPNMNYLDDWDVEDIEEAYLTVRTAEQEEW